MPVGIPWAPRSEPYQYSDAIPRLILEGGRIQAEGHRNSGSIWGQTVASLGNIAAQAMERFHEDSRAKAEEQKKALRDATFVKAVESWDGKDQKELFTGLTKILGAKDALEATKAIAAFQKQPAKLEDELGSLGTVLKFAEGQSDEVLGRFYPALRQRFAPVLGQMGIPAEALPEEWAPEMREQLKGLRASLPGGATALKTREVRTRNADNSETVQIVEDRPGQTFTSAAEPKKPETRTVEAQMAAAALVGDQTTYETLLRAKRDAERAGRAPEKPQLERVETVDADGKPVTKFVTPSVGATYAKPTGAGKPATGQQRRALSFFNRGKEAEEIAEQLETGDTIDPTRIKYTPEFANFLQSGPNQAYIQAQRAYTEARLRKESGAAVKDEEYEKDALTYFAQPGDSPETIKQKQAARKAVLAGIAFESGDALREFYGDEAEGMVNRFKTAGASPKGQPFDTSKTYGYKDGDVIEGPGGKRKTLRNGRWEDVR